MPVPLAKDTRKPASYVHIPGGVPDLNTETALDRLEEGRLKEAATSYEPDFEEWDAFLSEVLEWL